MQGKPNETSEAAKAQGPRCAYCEGPLFNKGHIEHFRRRRDFAELSFDWPNLFLACDSTDHCGHYKDRQGASDYDPALLIKPDHDEPQDYLYFHSTGEVRKRAGLDATNACRAEETIRVLGLNNAALTGARAKALKVYKARLVGDLHELDAWPAADRRAYLQEEIEAIRHQPYASTIQHFLQNSAS